MQPCQRAISKAGSSPGSLNGSKSPALLRVVSVVCVHPFLVHSVEHWDKESFTLEGCRRKAHIWYLIEATSIIRKNVLFFIRKRDSKKSFSQAMTTFEYQGYKSPQLVCIRILSWAVSAVIPQPCPQPWPLPAAGEGKPNHLDSS